MSEELGHDEQTAVGRKAKAAVLAALKQAGGRGTRRDLTAWAKDNGAFTQRELAAPTPEKHRHKYASYVDYRLSWAFTNLKKSGQVENPRWSEWQLTGLVVERSTPRIDAQRLAELRTMRYRDYLRSDEWKRTRGAALTRADHSCQVCKRSDRPLNVHHNTYERRGTELDSDLIVLCEDCHTLYHSQGKLASPPSDLPVSVPPPRQPCQRQQRAQCRRHGPPG